MAVAGAAASASSEGSRSPPASPRFSLADCTADLLSIIVSYLGPRERAAFGGACSFHLTVLRMVAERGTTWGTVQQVNDPAAAAPPPPVIAVTEAEPRKPPPFGLGYVDRPRFLMPGELAETVVRSSLIPSTKPTYNSLSNQSSRIIPRPPPPPSHHNHPRPW